MNFKLRAPRPRALPGSFHCTLSASACSSPVSAAERSGVCEKVHGRYVAPSDFTRTLHIGAYTQIHYTKTGAYTYYTAPEESEVSITSRMEAEDEAMSPMEVLLMLFPDVEPQLLEAAFQEANGHLEQSVELLLTAMFFSSLETCQASVEAGSEDKLPPPGEDGSWADLPPPPPGSGGLSDLQLTELNDMQGEDVADQVLALTVPPGASAARGE